ncbi:MAG: hypothetical protein H0X12_02870 [Nocardioides sp.]|nr:hypothetical protein [Nocardioides sp.]
MLVDGAGITGIEEMLTRGSRGMTPLGAAILGRLSLAASGTDGILMAMVAAAIEEVADANRDTCNVADPRSPSATVAVVRVADGRADHLVLGTPCWCSTPSTSRRSWSKTVANPTSRGRSGRGAALEPGSPDFARLRSQSIAAFRERRNQPGGFWVAKEDGRVAEHAVIGSRPAAELRTVTLLSNGASRVVTGSGRWTGPRWQRTSRKN